MEELQSFLSTANYETTTIENFLIELRKLFKEKNSRTIDYQLFLLSIFTLLFKFENYTPLTTELYSNSGNCRFTLAKENDKLIFIKVVDISKKKDLVLYDVLCGIIFNYLIETNSSISQSIAKYRYSSFSYYNKYRSGAKIVYEWDYNELKDFENVKSPYYKDKVLSLLESDKIDDIYENRCHIFITDAISGGSFKDLFYEYFLQGNMKVLLLLFKYFYEFYDFLIDMGVNYGFIHNDLHLGNIFFNNETKKLILIDFGRSSFGFFIDSQNDIVNSKVEEEFKKLGYDVLMSSISPPKTSGSSSRSSSRSSSGGSNNYYEMYCNMKKDDDLFLPYNKSVKKNGKYLGIISDLITCSMNMYLRMSIFLRKCFANLYPKFNTYFSKLILIDYRNDYDNILINNEFKIKFPFTNITELINNYFEIINDYINEFPEENLKKCFRCILDGLLFSSLLFLKEGINNQTKQINGLSSILHTSFQFKKGQIELNDFIDFIIRELNGNLNSSQKNDLKESLNGKIFKGILSSSSITGGLVMNMKKTKRSETELIEMVKDVDTIDLNFNDKKTLKYYKKSFKNYNINNLPYPS